MLEFRSPYQIIARKKQQGCKMMNRFQQVSVGEKDPDLASSLQVGMMFSAI